MKKVLLVNDFEYEAGAEKVFRDTKKLHGEEYDISSFVGSEYHSVKSNPLEYIYSSSEKKRFYKTLLSVRPSIIHIHVFSHLLTSSVFSAIRTYKRQVNPNIKVVYTAHDFNLVCPNSGYMSYRKGKSIPLPINPPTLWAMLFLRLDKRSIVHSWMKKVQWIIGNKWVKIEDVIDVIITPSYFLKDVLNKKLPMKNIKVVRNPVEFKLIPMQSKCSQNGLRMVYFGRLSEEKGVYDFLGKMASTELDISLDIIGDGPERPKLEKMLELKGLKGRVRMLEKMGHEKLMKHLASQYDVMLLPSVWYENAPLSLVEAAKLRLAILGSDLGGIKEISNLCGNNFLFDPHSEKDVHDKLRLCFDYVKTGVFEVKELNEFDGDFYRREISIIYTDLIKSV